MGAPAIIIHPQSLDVTRPIAPRKTAYTTYIKGSNCSTMHYHACKTLLYTASMARANIDSYYHSGCTTAELANLHSVVVLHMQVGAFHTVSDSNHGTGKNRTGVDGLDWSWPKNPSESASGTERTAHVPYTSRGPSLDKNTSNRQST